ncbi:hypothetical protein GCM10023340_22880 [Nocardioides marinquilinus]|uniref:Soluble ligand binding domain-containing protein n=1 Tax=Nocardioides marinquilinus TaxID=1210400 RepID=A0ABP9PRR4_9ACTN
MRSRRPSLEHREAVSRRLALLSEQLAAGRVEAPGVEDGAVDEVNEVDEVDGLDDGLEAWQRPAAGGAWWDDHTRVVPARTPLAVVPEVLAPPARPVAVAAREPVRVPVPGRHAARRPVSWRDLVPETLRGRVRVGSSGLAVLAVLVAAGLALTCWWVVRGDPAPPEPSVPSAPAPVDGDLVAVSPVGAPTDPSAPPGPAASSPAAGPGGTPGTPPGTPSGTVTVDVAGKVRRPGIVVLDAGARVVDALEQAGGARPGVDLTTLNLARLLVDGEQLLVGVDPPPGTAAVPVAPPGVAPSATSPTAPAALVDLNLATQAELELLPEIGPVTAAAIVAWRDEHGGFTAVTELLEVTGIGDATLATVSPLVTV